MQDTPIKYIPTRARELVNRVERITLEEMGPEFIPLPPQKIKTMCTTKLFSPKANSIEEASYKEMHPDMITPSQHASFQRWLRESPLSKFQPILQIVMQCDGGANSYIFTDRRHFRKYVEIKATLTQVTGNTAPAIGMGIVLIKMQDSPNTLILYPYCHMLNKPQNTLEQSAIKYYREMRSVRIEILSWIRTVDKHGVKSFQSTIPYYHNHNS